MQHAYAVVVLSALLLGQTAEAEAEGELGSGYPLFLYAPWKLHEQPRGVSAEQWRAQLLSLADAGDPEAQYRVGRLREAAEGGYVYAMEALGLEFYRNARYGEAFPMLLGAARMGMRGKVTDALAKMLDKGWGTPRDKLKACYWRRSGCYAVRKGERPRHDRRLVVEISY
jgi:TPR repeat protein